MTRQKLKQPSTTTTGTTTISSGTATISATSSASVLRSDSGSRSFRQKRAQSIDWTEQPTPAQPQPPALPPPNPTMDHNHLQYNHQPQSQPQEDYYSVPRKSLRAVSSNYLDQQQQQQQQPDAASALSSEASWAADPKPEPYIFGASSTVPQPPPSPPPSPPAAFIGWRSSTSISNSNLKRTKLWIITISIPISSQFFPFIWRSSSS